MHLLEAIQFFEDFGVYLNLINLISYSRSFSYDEELALSNYIEFQLTNTTGDTTENYQENIDNAIPMLSNISKLISILKANVKTKVKASVIFHNSIQKIIYVRETLIAPSNSLLTMYRKTNYILHFLIQ